ncbi:MAG: SAM-dependent methyltransferase [Solidesulfovibrio sp. DCME]|uniref:SAM-dependent methyltransferase n=1 Tax=Solidesulfovibrio sp. DCME TaxID=3447380 RepID=UPI003D12DCFC
MPMPQAEATYTDRTFRAMPGGCAQLLAAAGPLFPAASPLRVLDIGCGTGELLFALAGLFPEARMVGVDISEDNIRQAAARLAGSGLGDRLEFVCGDYLRFDGTGFDLICSVSTLHLIPAATETLFAKIAAELRPGGLVLATLPVDGPHNRLLCLARRAFRGLRGPALEWALLRLARLVYGASVPAAVLEDRLEYMFILPRFLAGRAFEQALAAGPGLVVARREAEVPHRFGKLRHDLLTLAQARPARAAGEAS